MVCVGGAWCREASACWTRNRTRSRVYPSEIIRDQSQSSVITQKIMSQGKMKEGPAHLLLHNTFKNLWSNKHALAEKAMAPHSSTLAWKIPWTEEPGRLQSMGSRRVVHDCATSLPLFTFMHWRRKWQPTPVFLPRESQGRGSLVGCRLWGRTELDTTEAT